MIKSIINIISRNKGYRLKLKRANDAKEKILKNVVAWRGMSVAELSDSLRIDVDTLIQKLNKLSSDSQMIYSPNTELVNYDFIEAVVKNINSNLRLDSKFMNLSRLSQAAPVSITDFQSKYKPKLSEKTRFMVKRAPVVTIMGHVDHGKTTLLDKLRNSHIVDKEFGGITQHVGAFKVNLADLLKNSKDDYKDKTVTFIDTPGHAAFASMRSRGANCTDIVVLVIAAEDGIKPQTLESIRMAQFAGVPIIVAVNKLDKFTTSEAEMKSLLIEHNNSSSINHKAKELLNDLICNLELAGVKVEALGGSVQLCLISAMKSWGLDELMENIVLLGEILDLKGWRGDAKRDVMGVVVESTNHISSEGMGAGTVVLVQQGELRPRDIIVCGDGAYGQVRNMLSTDQDDVGTSTVALVSSGPSDPVKITGWADGVLPAPGEVFYRVDKVTTARQISKQINKIKQHQLAQDNAQKYLKKIGPYQQKYFDQRVNYLLNNYNKTDNYVSKTYYQNDVKSGHMLSVNILIKTDVEGSLEAIHEAMQIASESICDIVEIKLMNCSVGPLTGSDVLLVENTPNCLVYLFNLPVTSTDKYFNTSDINQIESQYPRVRHFNVIYHLFDDLQSFLLSQLPTITQFEVVGEAVVKQLFTFKDKEHGTLPVLGAQCVHGTIFSSQTTDTDYIFRLIRKGNSSSAHSDTTAAGSTTPNLEPSTASEDLLSFSLKYMNKPIKYAPRDSEFGIVLCRVNENNAPTKSYVSEAQSGDIIQCLRKFCIRPKLNWNIGF